MSRRKPWRSSIVAGVSTLSLAAVSLFALPANIPNVQADNTRATLMSEGWVDVVGHAIELQTAPNTPAATTVSWDVTALPTQNYEPPRMQTGRARIVIPATVPGPKTKDGKPTLIKVAQPRFTNIFADQEMNGNVPHPVSAFMELTKEFQNKLTEQPEEYKDAQAFLRDNPQYLFSVFGASHEPHLLTRARSSSPDSDHYGPGRVETDPEKMFLTDSQGRLLVAQSFSLPLADGKFLIAFSAIPRQTSDSWNTYSAGDYNDFDELTSAVTDRTLYLGEVKFNNHNQVVGEVENFRAIGSAAPFALTNPGDAKFNNVDLQELSNQALKKLEPYLKNVLASAPEDSPLADYQLPATVPISASALLYGNNVFPTEMVDISASLNVKTLPVPAFPTATNACDPARAAWPTDLPKIENVSWSKNATGELIATAQGSYTFKPVSAPRGVKLSADQKSANYGLAPGAARVCAPFLLKAPKAPPVFDLCGAGNAVWTLNLPKEADITWERSADGKTLTAIAAPGFFFDTKAVPQGVTLSADHTKAHYGTAPDSDTACVPDEAAASGDKTLIPAPATPAVHQECGEAPAWGPLPTIDHLKWETNTDGSVSAIADADYAFSADEVPEGAKLTDDNTKLSFPTPPEQASACPLATGFVLPLPPQPYMTNGCEQDSPATWYATYSQRYVSHARWKLSDTDEDEDPTPDSVLTLVADNGYVFTDQNLPANVWRSPDGTTLSFGKVPGPSSKCNGKITTISTDQEEKEDTGSLTDLSLEFKQVTDTKGDKWWVSSFIIETRLRGSITAGIEVVDSTEGKVQLTTDLPANANLQVPQQAFIDGNCRMNQSSSEWMCWSVLDRPWGRGITTTNNPNYVSPDDEVYLPRREREPLPSGTVVPPQLEGAQGTKDYLADITRGILQTDPNADALTATSGIYGNPFCFVARQPENPWQASTTTPAIIANELFKIVGIDAQNTTETAAITKLPSNDISPEHRFSYNAMSENTVFSGQIIGINWTSNDGCDQAAAFVSLKPLPELTVPAVPGVTDPCGTDNATWNEHLPTIEHVTWERSTNGKTLSARATDGFKFSTQNLPKGVTLSDNDTRANYGQAPDSGTACTAPDTPGTTPQPQRQPDNPLAQTGASSNMLALVALLFTAVGGTIIVFASRRNGNRG